MWFSVILCFFLTALLPLCSTHLAQEARYECGPHGKFEYCIDDIPGCVIGCHCHPGYYFDTDTKICEPNIKLTHDFRRHYFAEPTRVNAAPENYPVATEIIPTPTATNNIDVKVNEANKDTDELGDWLYNQFFKTIENQVINNSNNTNNDNKENRPPMRRSGGGKEPAFSKPKRRTRKSMRAGKKKKNMKVHGLRRKLLRITEDDSLFDSDSDSDSDDTDSDSSDSDSESDTSGDSSDTKKSEKDDKDDKNDKDHGHKKVIIFNRRPKPPLPSFIFLPSMDTPYYPPIGLPPPPPMPMYPMVPVPPMAPAMYPFPGPPRCDEQESNTTTSSPAASTPTSEATTTDQVPSSTTEPEPNPAVRAGDRRSRFEKHRMKKPMLDKFILRSKEPGKKPKLTHGQRSQFVQKLRDKMKEKRKNRLPPIDGAPDELIDGETAIIDEDLKEPSSLEAVAPKNIGEQIPKLDDVDFKYLSELIHRVNLSEAKGKLPSLPLNLNEDSKALQNIKLPQTRRNYDPYNVEPENILLEPNHHRKLQKQASDDIYYTNLGRQIASMIRNADSNIGYPVNPYAEQAPRQVPFHSVLEHSYLPQSFWERSVRSPLHQLPFGNYLDETRTLKHINDKNLLNLENEVEIFATTHPPLTLRDIENILNRIGTAQVHNMRYRDPLKVVQPQEESSSLNINLLPKYVKTDNLYRRLYNAPEKVEYYTEHYQAPLLRKIYVEIPPSNVTNTTSFHESNRHQASDLPLNKDYWMYNRNVNARQVFVAPTNKSLTSDTYTRTHGNQIYYNTNPTRRPPVPVTRPPILVTRSPVPVSRPESALVKKPRAEYLQFLRSMPVIKQTSGKRPEVKFISNPSELDFHTLNYFTGNRHHYTLEEATYPLQITTFKRQISKPHIRTMNPSYFHHALHHFDFFD